MEQRWIYLRTMMTNLWHIPFYLGRGWLVLWVLVVPLFHIHPDIDHAHGASSHVHRGQYHSVLSEDLSHELHGHSHSDPAPWSGTPSESVKSIHGLDPVFNYAEFSLSLLNKSGDDPLVPPGLGAFLTIGECPSQKCNRSSLQTSPLRSSPPTWLFAPQHRVRPPPVQPF